MNIYRKTIVLSIFLSFVILSYTENEFLSELTTQLVATVLSYFVGIIPATAGNILFLKMDDQIVPILITFGCTGFMFISVYTLIMFVMPGISLKHRLISLLVLPIIYLSNIARVVVGIMLGVHTNIPLMVLFHDTVGQVFVFIFMTGMLLIFLNIFGYIKLRRSL